MHHVYEFKSLTQFEGQLFDRIVILCAREEEKELEFHTPSKVLVRDFADPVEQPGTDEERARLFTALTAELAVRIRLLLNLLVRERREQYSA